MFWKDFLLKLLSLKSPHGGKPPLAPLTDRNKPAVWAATPREAGWISIITAISAMVSTCFKCLQAQWAMIKMIIFWGGNWSANFEHRCICHCHGGAKDECHDLRNDGSTEDWGSPWSSTLYTLSIDINSYFSILFLCPYLFLTFSSCFPSVFHVFISFYFPNSLRIKRSPKLPLFCPFQAWHFWHSFGRRAALRLHRWLPSPLSLNRRCTWCCPFSGPTSASPHRNRPNDTRLKYVDFFCGPHWKPAVVASSTTCASKRDVFRLHDLPSSHTTSHIPCHIPSIPSTKTHSYSHHGPPITYQMLSIILNSHSVFMPRELLNESTPIVLLCPFRLPAGPPFTEWNEVKRWWNGAASDGFRKLSRTGAKHLCICRTCHRAVRARWCRSCMSAEVTSWTTSRPQLWRDMDWGGCETARTGSTNLTDDAHNGEDTLGFMKIMKVLQVLAWVIEWEWPRRCVLVRS